MGRRVTGRRGIQRVLRCSHEVIDRKLLAPVLAEEPPVVIAYFGVPGGQTQGLLKIFLGQTGLVEHHVGQAEQVGRIHIAEALSYRRRAPVN